jgi:hypothetical protein
LALTTESRLNPLLSQNLMTFSDLVPSRGIADFCKTGFEPSRMKFRCSDPFESWGLHQPNDNCSLTARGSSEPFPNNDWSEESQQVSRTLRQNAGSGRRGDCRPSEGDDCRRQNCSKPIQISSGISKTSNHKLSRAPSRATNMYKSVTAFGDTSNT